MRINYFVAGGFVVLIFLVIIFVTTVLPAFTFQPKPTPVAHQYTEKERAGRNIYRREGCYYCHSQFSRYQDREAGELVQAGDYVYETPHVLGTSERVRIYPTLVASTPDDWHRAHHNHPRKVKPGSIMPNYSFLSDEEMDQLIAYLQTIGAKRPLPSWIPAPQEIRDEMAMVKSHVNVNSSAAANAGRGIYMQNCAVCHGVNGLGNGPVSNTMLKKPANFTRPFYKNYSDEMWYWRVKEGVAGTRMPRWGKTLGKEQMLYLVAFLKTLPKDGQPRGAEITSFDQLDNKEALSENFKTIHKLGEGTSHRFSESDYDTSPEMDQNKYGSSR